MKPFAVMSWNCTKVFILVSPILERHGAHTIHSIILIQRPFRSRTTLGFMVLPNYGSGGCLRFRVVQLLVWSRKPQPLFYCLQSLLEQTLLLPKRMSLDPVVIVNRLTHRSLLPDLGIATGWLCGCSYRHSVSISPHVEHGRAPSHCDVE